jgi:hypothetical protein
VGEAKNLIVKPIAAQDANKIIKRLHYSGKVVNNSQLHLGVFFNGRCGGAMQFGPSMRKDLIRPLVADTGWNEFMELNRLAFADWLPRNGESRAIAYAMRFIKKNYPFVKWIISFADGTQCGDGTIYRASGFYLTGIKVNKQLRINPHTGQPMQSMAAFHKCLSSEYHTWRPLEGYQLRYIYFLDPTAKDRLTVPILPFSEIEKRGAGMYKGIKRVTKATSGDQLEGGGAIPTHALQDKRPKQAMTGDQPEQREGSAHPDAPKIKRVE